MPELLEVPRKRLNCFFTFVLVEQDHAPLRISLTQMHVNECTVERRREIFERIRNRVTGILSWIDGDTEQAHGNVRVSHEGKSIDHRSMTIGERNLPPKSSSREHWGAMQFHCPRIRSIEPCSNGFDLAFQPMRLPLENRKPSQDEHLAGRIANGS